MSEEIIEDFVEVVPNSVAEVVPVPEVQVEEKRYSYQPTDGDGRPIGGLQVIKYKTPEELAEKLAEQNSLLLRKLREETRKTRLGIVENDPIPEDAPRIEKLVEFKKRVL